jgi:hypothetical protein
MLLMLWISSMRMTYSQPCKSVGHALHCGELGLIMNMEELSAMCEFGFGLDFEQWIALVVLHILLSLDIFLYTPAVLFHFHIVLHIHSTQNYYI